jgi:hypothetical protein
MFILLVLLIVILIVLILKGVLPYSSKFTVKAGHHYPKPLFLCIFLLFKSKVLNWKVSFDATWRYDLKDEDQLDINKITGIGFLPWHHIYSVRFGGRYNIETDRVEVMPYVYIHGERIRINDETGNEIVLANCLLNDTEYDCQLIIDKVNYTFQVFRDGIPMGKKVVVKKGHKQFLGYGLHPYFGGNKKAPHDFNTKISYK